MENGNVEQIKRYKEAVVSLKEILLRTQDQSDALLLAIETLEAEIKYTQDRW